jgi:hypothetical protein
MVVKHLQYNNKGINSNYSQLKSNAMNYHSKNQTSLLALLFFLLFSCQVKDSEPTESLSNLSAEQQKERLDQEGIDFINHLEDLENPDLMDPLVYFIEISQYLENDQFDLSAKVAHSFIQSSKKHSGNPLKSAITNDATSFKKMMSDNQGTYTYNRNSETWSKKAATNKIEFVFPANKSTTTNNTTFTFSNLNTITVTNTDIYEDLIDLPKTLDVNLKVGNVLKYGYSIANEYNSDNIPTKESTTLVIAPYKFIEEYSLSKDKTVAFNSTISKDNSTFMTIGATSDGVFTNDMLTADSIVEEDIVNKVNAFMQIENVKVAGNLEFKPLAIKQKELEKKYEKQYNNYNDQYPKAYYTELASSIDSNGSLKMLFVDKNEVFAKLIPYVSNEQDWYYSYNNGHYNRVEYTRYDISFKLEFTDGSKVDESYFDEGFSKFVDKLNSIIRKINNDYDEEVEEIEY